MYSIVVSSTFGCNKISLKSYFGKYIVAESDGTVNAIGVNPYIRETFTVEEWGSNGISLRAYNGKYLAAEDENQAFDIKANRDVRRSWETFTVEKQTGGTISLKTAHGRYVTSEPDGRLIGDRKVSLKWESFRAECIQGLLILF